MENNCSCYYCNSCYYCKNLRMTEYNLFCYSKEYNDDNSFQQKRYRAFNKEVGRERYYQILSLVKSILLNKDLKLNEYWKQVTQDQWRQLLDIPEARDFKEGFEYISGCEINLDQVEVVANGKTVFISKESAESLGLV